MFSATAAQAARPPDGRSRPALERSADRGLRYEAALWSCVALGLLLQSVAFVSNRSLWIDEAMLARNIVSRSFGELTGPLSYDQGAPLGYLLLVKSVVTVGGSSEFALRAPSLLAGVAALLVFVTLARRYLDRTEALVACALFCVAPGLVYYAAEAKQYAMDVLVATALLYLGLRLQESWSGRAVAALAAGGAVAIWLSYPSVFVLGTVGVLVAARTWSAPGRNNRVAVAAIGVTWLVSFVILYAMSVRHLVQNDALHEYWDDGFMPRSPLAAMQWGWSAYAFLFRWPFADAVGPLLAFLFTVGLIWLLMKRSAWAWLVGGPCLLAVLASALRLYPFGSQGGGLANGRLMLFALPTVVLGCAVGWRVVADRRALVSAVLVVLIGLPALQTSIRHARGGVEELRPLIEYMGTEVRDGDGVYVYAGAEPAFSFYAMDRGYLAGRELTVRHDSGRLVAGRLLEPSDYDEELRPFVGSGRVWLVFSHAGERGHADEAAMLSAATKYASEIVTLRAPNASVRLLVFEP
jgi:hypothetical protein